MQRIYIFFQIYYNKNRKELRVNYSWIDICLYVSIFLLNAEKELWVRFQYCINI